MYAREHISVHASYVKELLNMASLPADARSLVACPTMQLFQSLGGSVDRVMHNLIARQGTHPLDGVSLVSSSHV